MVYLILPKGYAILNTTTYKINSGIVIASHYFLKERLILIDILAGLSAGTHTLFISTVVNPISDNTNLLFSVSIVESYLFTMSGEFTWPAGSYLIPSTPDFTVVYKNGSLSLPYETFTISFTTKKEHAVGGTIKITFPDTYDLSLNLGGGTDFKPYIESLTGITDQDSSNLLTFTILGTNYEMEIK